MVGSVDAEIVAIGTEILLGEITDTNSVHLAHVLRDHGINLFFMTSVGDNAARIRDVIQIALGRAQIVITCGGLGPTVDDVTRQGIADAVGQPLEYHEELHEAIAARFATYRAKMTDNNRRQAFLPSGAIVVENPVGTAPAFIVEQDAKCVISLPGVPREMKYLMQTAILPYLREKYELGIIKSRNLRAAGIGESSLDTLLGTDLLEQANPTVGLAAHHGVIDIRITAKALDEATALQMLAVTEAQVKQRAGEHIFGVDGDELEAVLLQLLHDNDLKVAVVEAGIHDAVDQKLRSQSGFSVEQHLVSNLFRDPVEAAQTYGINLSSGLRSVAEAITEQLMQDETLDAAITILSFPDVDESEDTAEATAVVVATRRETKSRAYGFGGMNMLTANWVSRWAMAYLWRSLKEVSS